MPLPRDISGSAQRSLLDGTGFYQPGDYVVPEYSEGGTKTKNGQVVDETGAMDLAKKMASYAVMEGAEPLPQPDSAIVVVGEKSKPRKGKRKEVNPTALDIIIPQIQADGFKGVPQQPGVIPPIIRAPIEVVFSTQLGRIKVNVYDVLDSLSALVLVFKDESEIRYEPAPGANVQLVINGKLENTMYPGFKLPWIDNKMQLMIFVKLSES